MPTHDHHSPSPESDDAWLDELLRQPAEPSARAAARDDSAAFTSRVMAALPPPAAAVRRRYRSRRAIVVSAAALAGGACAWACSGGTLAESVHELIQIAAEAGAQLQGTQSVTNSIVVGTSAIVMLVLAGRSSFRRLLS